MASSPHTESHPSIQRIMEKAFQHHQKGRLDKAEKFYREALKAGPHNPLALHMLGVLTHQTGRNNEAVDLIGKALHLKEAYPEAHCNLGVVLQELGRYEESAVSLKKALKLNPVYPEAFHNLGNSLRQLGKTNESIECYRSVIRFDNHNAEAHHGLGLSLMAVGDRGGASASLRTAIALDRDKDEFWWSWARCLDGVSFETVDDNLLRDLLGLMEREDIDPQQVIRTAISALKHVPGIPELYASVLTDNFSYRDAAEKMAAIPLLGKIMELGIIDDLGFEKFLTRLRKAMIQEDGEDLIRGDAPSAESEHFLSFQITLALHCFTNEYVYFETVEEAEIISLIQNKISSLVETGEDIPPRLLATLGAYRPLYIYSWAAALTENYCDGDMGRLIIRQVAEPLEERALGAKIPCLSVIKNTLSEAVRAQYEESPYPRWIRLSATGQARTVREAFEGPPLNVAQGEVFPENPSILIAGCGTGRQAIAAATIYANSTVTAVDLSRASLSYALRKTREAGVSNIDYIQGDILELGCLNQRFHIVECAGVLHHMEDPMAGWRILTNLLEDNGLMMIGLYSKTAHQHILKAHDLISKNGHSSSLEDIRRYRQEIISLAESGDPEMIKVVNTMDFFSLSECRDMLFHVQDNRFTLQQGRSTADNRFTLPQIEAALKKLGLKFMCFEISNPPSNIRPTDSLSKWHDYEIENPDTFLEMYQFWAIKKR